APVGPIGKAVARIKPDSRAIAGWINECHEHDHGRPERHAGFVALGCHGNCLNGADKNRRGNPNFRRLVAGLRPREAHLMIFRPGIARCRSAAPASVTIVSVKVTASSFGSRTSSFSVSSVIRGPVNSMSIGSFKSDVRSQPIKSSSHSGAGTSYVIL